MNTKNLMPQYAGTLPRALFDRTPKAVFAAVARAPYMNGGAVLYVGGDTAAGAIVREWRTQHLQGLIPNPPPSDRWLAQRGVALTEAP